MFDETGSVFFDALRQVADRLLEREHPCIRALGEAASNPSPTSTALTQDELAALDPATISALMAGAQKLLRENPGQILARWSFDGRSQ